MTKPTIDPEFRDLIPPMSAEERAQLTANVLREGCRDPLVVWKSEQILLDGHNRFEICEQNEIPYETKEIDLPNRDAAKDWIIKNQLGRRNLTEQQVQYLRGKKYEVAKQSHGGQLSKKGSYQNDNSLQKTVEKVASETGVSAPTVIRNEKFAIAVDQLSKLGGQAVKSALLNGSIKMSTAAAPAVKNLTARQKSAVAKKIAAGKVRSVDQAIKDVAPEALKAAPKKAAAISPKLWREVRTAVEELDRLLAFPQMQISFFHVKKQAKTLLDLVSGVNLEPHSENANDS